MIPWISARGAAIAATTLALSTAAAVAAQAPASALTFTATYSCSVPTVGTETVTVDGDFTASPSPATVASPVSFDLSVESLSVTSPVVINSWNASADVIGRGAEGSTFQVTGSGGAVPAGQQITNANLTGRWTPTTPGVDEFTIGGITISANTGIFGEVSVACTPTGAQPVAEALTVR
jgi:hypothetical protein